MDAVAESKTNPVSKHERSDAERDDQSRLTRPNFQARTVDPYSAKSAAHMYIYTSFYCSNHSVIFNIFLIPPPPPQHLMY